MQTVTNPTDCPLLITRQKQDLYV